MVYAEINTSRKGSVAINKLYLWPTTAFSGRHLTVGRVTQGWTEFKCAVLQNEEPHRDKIVKNVKFSEGLISDKLKSQKDL